MRGMPTIRRPKGVRPTVDAELMDDAQGSNHGPSNDHAAGPSATPNFGIAVDSLKAQNLDGSPDDYDGDKPSGQSPYPPIPKGVGTNQPKGPRGAPLFAPHSPNGGQIGGRFRKIGG